MTLIRSMILVGAGFASTTHWIPAISRSAQLKLIGVIDPDEQARGRAVKVAPGIWTVARMEEIPSAYRESIVFVATPNNMPVIRELAAFGFRELIVEKPLVSRDAEIDELEGYVHRGSLNIYSIDHYHQKFLPCEFVLGRLQLADPRVGFLEVRGNHDLKEIPGLLGAIEGVTYTNIEAGDLGIPYLDAHPWLEHNQMIGGVLRDLGPHAFDPLIRTRLTSADATIMDVGLARLNAARDGFMPVRSQSDIEMWVRALMVWNGITANVAFGKAPFPGKERSLAVRAANGVFFAGLARGQSSVLMTNDGRITRLSLRKSENDLVLKEALAFLEDKLPLEFDGNVSCSLDALRLNRRLREKYFKTTA